MSNDKKVLIEFKKQLLNQISEGICRGDIKRTKADEAVKTLVQLLRVEIRIESEESPCQQR